MPASPSKAKKPALQSELPSTKYLATVVGACFFLGFATPLALGIHLAPRPLGMSKKSELKRAAIARRNSSKPTQAEGAEARVSLSRPSAVLTEHETTSIRSTVVAGCGDNGSKFGNQCDQPHLLTQLEEPLRLLAQCKAAEGASGLLSLGLKLDFRRGHVSRVKSGKSTTLPTGRAAALIACAQTSIVGTPLRGIEHDHRYYWIYYLTEFVPPGSPISETAAELKQMIPTSGRATVGWNSAQVRKSPDHTAKLTAELEFGTRVQVTGRLGAWYQVKFGNPTNEGWVHETALGL